jgi:hypothetical protein
MSETLTAKPGRGGARPGAGRKPKAEHERGTVQVSIHFTPDILAALDARALAQGKTRSGLLRELLNEIL